MNRRDFTRLLAVGALAVPAVVEAMGAVPRYRGASLANLGGTIGPDDMASYQKALDSGWNVALYDCEIVLDKPIRFGYAGQGRFTMHRCTAKCASRQHWALECGYGEDCGGWDIQDSRFDGGGVLFTSLTAPEYT